MRIGISGSHFVGKSSLAIALAQAMPNYELVPEPYQLLADSGYEFGDLPVLEDYLVQLDRSIEYIQHSVADTVFDRCPLDFLAYLQTHSDAARFDLAAWMPRIRAAIAKLNLIVFLPIEDPDRFSVARSQLPLRAEVNAILHEIIVKDRYGLGADVLEVTGTPEARLEHVLAGFGSNC